MNRRAICGLLSVATIGFCAARTEATIGEVRVQLPAEAARLVEEPRGTIELDLAPDQIQFLVGGKLVTATLVDTFNNWNLSGTSGWPLKNETGVMMTRGPDGPAIRFTTGCVVCNPVRDVATGQQWTAAFWLRPDDPDWGTVIKKSSAPPPLMRPTIVSLGGETNSVWAVRLSHMRLEVVIGPWTAWGATRLPVGRWTHVVVVRDGPQVRVFLDGKPEALAPGLLPDGTRSKDAALAPVSDQEAPHAGNRAGILRLASAPPATKDGMPELREKLIGAIGSFSLEDRPWTDAEASSHANAGREEADRLSIRYSVLDDPVVGAMARFQQPRLHLGETSEAFLRRTAWWRQAKYGRFICWGPSALTAKELSWSRGTNADQTPPEIYDNLYKRFNPSNYDANVWAEGIKSGGMKYAVLLVKHHDGFCFWPTKTCEYSIAFTPYKQDTVGPYVAAMRKAGIRVGFYFSWWDWWYEERMKKEKGPDRKDWYKPWEDYCLAQERELCTNYGPIDDLWFDGAAGEVFDGIERVQPQMMINDRGTPSDYFTPENYMLDRPIINPNGSDALWENCSGIGGYWGYPSEKPWCKRDDLIKYLAEVVAKGGNWLLNVAPWPDGRMPEFHIALLREVGQWLEANGESIYGTHRTHLGWQPFGWTTANDTTLFLHVLRWPGKTLTVSDLYDQVRDVRLLAGKRKLSFKQTESVLTVDLPAAAPDAADTVIAVRVRHAPRTKIVKGLFINRARGGEATASAAYDVQTADKVFDGSPGTKWFTDTHATGWLQYRFGNGAAWAITRYALRCVNPPERDPKDWELLGSNNGIAWTTLDTRHNEDFPGDPSTRIFEFPNTKAYTYYRLNVTANHGAPGLQVDELELLTYSAGKP